MAAQWRPDLILLDLSMPDMTGWDVAARLRDDVCARAPIVIISANARELEAAPREGQHHDDVMAKPLRLDLLLETIGRLLGVEWMRLESDVAPVAESAATLSPAQLDELRALAAIGYVRGIRQRLDSLGDEFPALSAALEPLRAPIAEYRLDDFVTALDRAGAAVAAS
jgi:DNA-binding response OmpR family regulator